MEAAALMSWREKLAEMLIPPGARESVMGDLRETCASEAELLCEVFRTAPYVILSQMRRNLNLPALLLQMVLAIYVFGHVGALLIPVFLLASAFQPMSRPYYRRALRGAVLISFSGPLLFLLLPWLTGHVLQGGAYEPGFLLVAGLPGFLLVAGPLSLLLCCLRTALILLGDRRLRLINSNCSTQDLIRLYRNCVREIRCLAFWEAGFMTLVGLGLASVHVDGLPTLLLALLYGATAILVLVDQFSSNRVKIAEDLFAFRAQYCRVLMRRHRTRCFVSWVWFAPAFMALQMLANQGALECIEAGIAALLLCFVAMAINQESSGRAGEEIDLLARLNEKGWAPEHLTPQASSG